MLIQVSSGYIMLGQVRSG